jgi:hypothetical protein
MRWRRRDEYRFGVASRIAVLVVALLSTSARAAERFLGLAYIKDSAQPVYREVHWLFSDGSVVQRLVLYECLHGEPFARKLVRNSPSATAPDFDFEDGRDGYREGVHTSGDSRDVYVQPERQAPVERRMLPAARDGIIDAGFDAYVRQHWRELPVGNPRILSFLVPGRFAFMQFKLSAPQNGMLDAHPVTFLHMRLGAWYSFAAPTIEFVYERDGSRLVQFQGPGTVRSADGWNLNVRVVFPAREHVENVSDAEVSRARMAPLNGRCSVSK